MAVAPPFSAWAGPAARYLLQIGGVAVATFAAARFGLLFAFQPVEVTLVWPPTGIAIAALALFGYRLVPGVAIGIAVTTLSRGYPLPQVTADVASNCLEALLGVFLLRRVVALRPTLERLSDVLGFAGVAVLVAPLGAMVGVAGLLAGGTLPAAQAPDVWLLWALGDGLGI